MATKKDTAAGKTVKVTLVKSTYGQIHRHRATVRGLGLRRMHQTVVVNDTPEVRGMLHSSRHLLRVEEA
ncbi:MAG: 50S ribosomal protein L30 [Gammaproteobacteria bacterium]|jgi:large subunit ribosomal protein L30|nr:50S ribosomal protein L30 [Gammaproteobacteria bacterium]MDH5175749.1 50S ribosomal protein L30 [Gammaproteobacteria bacterium]MDH5228186.1 50S ribosomal protein L30 [Gammaproteobacteria bacterium]